MGSSFYVTINNSMQSIAELTFFEIIRHYGLLMGNILISMLMYPYIMYKRYYNKKLLLVAYTGYLVMCITNPFIFFIKRNNNVIYRVISSFYSFRITSFQPNSFSITSKHVYFVYSNFPLFSTKTI